MGNFFKSRFYKVVISLCIICAGAAFYSYNYTSATIPTTGLLGTLVSPIQNVFADISGFFTGLYDRTIDYNVAVDENADLKNTIAELEEIIRNSEYALIQNTELKHMLNIVEKTPEYSLDIAEIIGRSSSNTSNIITIDKGINSGISVNNTVITNEGFVGYVSRVGLNYAQITTIVDPSIEIGAIVTRTRNLGVIEGDLELLDNGCVRLSYIDKNVSLEIGDVIETSGVSGLYPKGVVIGYIEHITVSENGISKSAIIRPSVKVDDINQVYIIKSF